MNPHPVTAAAATNANATTVQPDAPASAGWQTTRQADQAVADYRTCLAVLVFYLIDAAFMALFSSLGVGSGWSAAWFALVGLVVAGGGALVVRRRGAGGLDDPRLVAVQAGSALCLTLAVALWDPAFMALMLLTVIVIIPTAALRLSPRGLLMLCVAAAAASAGVVMVDGGRLNLPADGGAQRVLSGLFLLWTLAKGASINVAGMALRLQLDDSHTRLEAALARVKELAERDELTGLPNRRRVMEALAAERERHARSGIGFAVAMLDIDHFKRINDRYGHPVGDAVLKAVGQLLTGTLRGPDVVGRVGGEEFLLVLPGATVAEAAGQAAERVRAAIAAHDWGATAPELAVTASIGVAVALPGEPLERLIDRADRGLYRAKSGGRNQVAREADGPG